MTFREFVEGTKDAVEALTAGLKGERDLTPMLHLESQVGMDVMAVDPLFFTSLESRERLVEKAVSVILSQRATKVAWSFCAWATDERAGVRPAEAVDRYEVVIAAFVDRERHEVWQAPLFRSEPMTFLGEWAVTVNSTEGPLITPIQEALR